MSDRRFGSKDLAIAVRPVGGTDGGLAMHFDSVGDNSVQTIKGSAGNLYALDVYNINAVDAFIQIYDVSGTITVGTTTPNLSILVPKGDGVNYGAVGRTFVPPVGFSNSIKYACTTTPTGSGNPTVGLVVNALYA